MKHLLLTTIAAVVLVGCENPDGALFQAVKDINIEAAKQAIADGADVNAKDQNGRTPLQLSVLKSHTEVAELLIAKGADVNVKEDLGEYTPSHLAALYGQMKTAELLIANGADVNAMDDNGDTPRNWAAAVGHKEIAELLIASGADVNVKGVDGETALDIATDPENPNASAETADLLRKHGAKTGEELKAEGK